MEFFELSHDILATKIASIVAPDLRIRREMREFIESRYDPKRTGILLSKTDIEYIQPHLDNLNLPADLQKFVNRSLRAQRNRRLQIRGTLTVLFIILCTASSIFYFQSKRFKGLYLIAQAKQIFERDPTHALDTALLAYEAYPDSLVQNDLYKIYASNYLFYDVVAQHSRPITHAIFHRSRNTIYYSLEREDSSGYYPILTFHITNGQIDTLSAKTDDDKPIFDITKLTLSNDSTHLIAATKRGCLHFWELDNKQNHKKLCISNEQRGELLPIPLPDHKSVLAVFSDSLYLWDIPSQKLVKKDKFIETDKITGIGLIGGESVVIGLQNGLIISYHSPTSKIDTLNLSVNYINQAYVWGEGNLLISYNKKDETLDNVFLAKYAFSSTKNELDSIWTKSIPASITNIGVSQEGKNILLTAQNQALFLNQNGDVLYKLLGHHSVINSGIVIGDSLVFTAGYDQDLRLWSAPRTNPTVLAKFRRINDIHWANNGQIYVATDQRIFIGQTNQNNTQFSWLDTIEVPLVRRIGDIDVSKDGGIIASSGTEKAYFWQNAASPPITINASANINMVAIHPNNQLLLTSQQDSITVLWNTAGDSITTLQNEQQIITQLHFSPNGQDILTGSENHQLQLWNREGEEVETLLGHQSSVRAAKFASDGHYIVSGEAYTGGKLLLWDSHGKLNHSFIIDKDEGMLGMIDIAFHPSQEIVATISQDFHLRLWELNAGRLIYTFSETPSVNKIAFSPNGKYLMAATRNQLEIYHVDKLGLNNYKSLSFK